MFESFLAPFIARISNLVFLKPQIDVKAYSMRKKKSNLDKDLSP